MKSLLSALGLSASKPTPPTFKFSEKNPMGTFTSEETPKEAESSTTTDGQGSEWYHLSSSCKELINQAMNLKTLNECISASERVLTAVQTQSSRRVILRLLSSLSQADPAGYLKAIETVHLDNIQHLIRLLRLVQAKRVDQDTISSGLLNCIESAITTIASQGSQSGAQLLQVPLVT